MDYKNQRKVHHKKIGVEKKDLTRILKCDYRENECIYPHLEFRRQKALACCHVREGGREREINIKR